MNLKVKQVKIAQSIRGETSNILTDAKYLLTFDVDVNMLYVTPKMKSSYGPYIVFPANIAYMELSTENVAIDKEEAPKKAKK